MSLLEVSHLRKSFDDRVVVDDLSFQVESGEIFGLMGPNGAGKSTTMMMVAGLRRPDSGTIVIDGRPAGNGAAEGHSRLGLVPQDLAIYPDLRTRENLDFFGRVNGVGGGELAERIDRVLRQTGLAPHADEYVRNFSGGMKRRLNFGVALMHQPRLVILDEPTVGVDTQSRTHLLDSVRELAASGVGVIYASHYMEEIESLCDRVAIIDQGRMLQCGALDELLDRSRSDLHLHVRGDVEALRAAVQGQAEVQPGHEGTVSLVVRRFRSEAPEAITARLEAVLSALRQARAELVSIETQEQDLERLFLELTGRKLRD